MPYLMNVHKGVFPVVVTDKGKVVRKIEFAQGQPVLVDGDRDLNAAAYFVGDQLVVAKVVTNTAGLQLAEVDWPATKDMQLEFALYCKECNESHDLPSMRVTGRQEQVIKDYEAAEEAARLEAKRQAEAEEDQADGESADAGQDEEGGSSDEAE